MNLIRKVIDRYRRYGLIQAARNALRGFVERYGPTSFKRVMWNMEFAGGRWNHIDHTAGDCVYPVIEKYAMGQSILDLGCGAGNTSTELPFNAYGEYMGIDISDVAVEKARKRSAETGRSMKNRFSQGDIYSYVPIGRYQVVLFRESLYYFTMSKIKTMLDRYAHFLQEGGVFIVRMGNIGVDRFIGIIENNYDVIDRYLSEEPKAIILVFRTRRTYEHTKSKRIHAAVSRERLAEEPFAGGKTESHRPMDDMVPAVNG